MGRPLNPRYFGSEEGKIAIKFHNGTTVVKGYVIRQTGSISYEVSDGTVTKVVSLAQTREEALALTGDLATFEVFTANGTDYVKKLEYTQAFTVSGNSVLWADAMTKSLPDWVAALRAPNGDYPVAVSDFQNGRYFFGGAEHTLAETWDCNYPAYYVLDPEVDIVPGVGLTYTGHTGAMQTGAVATPAFFTSMGFDSGSITCVVDATMSATVDVGGKRPYYDIACISDYDTFDDGWEFGYTDTGGFAQTFYDLNDTNGPYDGGPPITGAPGMGPRRDVVQFTTTDFSYTDDGSEAVTSTNTVDGTHFEVLLLQLGYPAGSNPPQGSRPGEATATIHKMCFYPLQPVSDLNDLP